MHHSVPQSSTHDRRLLDIHELLIEKGGSMCGVPGRKCLYHKPCHTPMEPHGAPRVLANVLPGRNVAMPDGCCGKAGTLAVIPPDISVMIRLHKEEELVHPATHGGIDPVLF